MEAQRGVAPYRIDAEIAHSSICTIYRAHEESLDRPVLIKKLHPQMAREEDIRKRFEREAQVCARVKHENIVDIYSYKAESDETMLVMEFVEGENLGDLIRRQGRIEWQAVLVMLAGVLKGLGHAHSKGVNHRDIKPDNLLVSSIGQIKITDFGLATIADATRMTMQGAVVGTPAYLPPEQVSGGTSDHRGDLFSTGVSFYEAVTGISPFSGQSFSETLKKILTYSPPHASSLVPEVPSELDQILERLLEKKPSNRYGSADQALEDVKRLAQHKGVVLERSTVIESLKLESSRPVAVIPTKTESTIQSLGRKSIPIWALGVGLAALAGLLFLVPGREELIGKGFPKVKSTLMDAASAMRLLQPATPVKGEGGTVSGSVPEKAASDTDGKPALNPSPEKPQTRTPGSGSGGRSITPPIGTAAPGSLTVTSKPWASVTIDNVSFGQTPLAGPIKLNAGQHVVALSNPEFPTSFVESIEIKSDENSVLDVNLWDYVGTIQIRNVKPWAEVIVDGVSYGLTPRAKPIIVSFGRHLIELRNPDFKNWQREVDLTQEQPSMDISAQLEPTGQ